MTMVELDLEMANFPRSWRALHDEPLIVFLIAGGLSGGLALGLLLWLVTLQIPIYAQSLSARITTSRLTTLPVVAATFQKDVISELTADLPASFRSAQGGDLPETPLQFLTVDLHTGDVLFGFTGQPLLSTPRGQEESGQVRLQLDHFSIMDLLRTTYPLPVLMEPFSPSPQAGNRADNR